MGFQSMVLSVPKMKTACVTGATGMIGRWVVRRLLQRGYRVRILSRRQPPYPLASVNVHIGNISSRDSLKFFLSNAHILFHCAGELRNTDNMWAVNVEGTRNLWSAAQTVGIQFFCHISSAGVIGKTYNNVVNEQTPCNPQNLYEQTKLEAEKIVAEGFHGCKTVILRPTNVVDEHFGGAVWAAMGKTFADRLKILAKGAENAHIIHAADVADAGIYMVDQDCGEVDSFFVSCDHDPLNTLNGLRRLYLSLERNVPVETVSSGLTLPVVIPYLFRKWYRGEGNMGDIRYSSKKLISRGFQYSLGVSGAVEHIAVSRKRCLI